MNLNLDHDLLKKQRVLIAEMIHDQHDLFRINKDQRELLEGIWELLSELSAPINQQPIARRPHALIIVDGGVVQNVVSDLPLDYTLIDYDVNDEENVFQIPQTEGEPEDAYVHTLTAEIDCPWREAVLSSIEEQNKES